MILSKFYNADLKYDMHIYYINRGVFRGAEPQTYYFMHYRLQRTKIRAFKDKKASASGYFPRPSTAALPLDSTRELLSPDLLTSGPSNLKSLIHARYVILFCVTGYYHKL